ncbi:MAG: S49 family peptidase [Pseudomonadota bacterium]|nr:S49 family peptidase [Pseudomonadota bacterium]
MRRKSWFERFLPRRLRPHVALVPLVRLSGTIGVGAPLRTPLTLQSVNDRLERAFSRPGIAAVALAVNSPGGSAAQSALIAGRIGELSRQYDVKVIAFIEDVAASGGYWIASSADEIYADRSSIVGSIGVLAAGFGFVDAMSKLGIERRVYTAGEKKVILDPFQPERREDVQRLHELQGDIHEAFKDAVRERRGSRLRQDDPDLFSGAFWTGRKALELGLIDGLGHMHAVLRAKFGDRVEVLEMQRSPGWLQRRFGMAAAAAGSSLVASLGDEIEVRALWGRYGL